MKIIMIDNDFKGSQDPDIITEFGSVQTKKKIGSDFKSFFLLRIHSTACSRDLTQLESIFTLMLGKLMVLSKNDG